MLYEVITYFKSATSVGANYEEAQGAASMADFACKLRIALKELRESNYWLRLICEFVEEGLVKNRNLQRIK